MVSSSSFSQPPPTFMGQYFFFYFVILFFLCMRVDAYFRFVCDQRRWWPFAMCWEDGAGRPRRLLRRLRVSLETRGSTVSFLSFFNFFCRFCVLNSQLGAHGIMMLVLAFDWSNIGNLIEIFLLRKLVLELYRFKCELDYYVSARNLFISWGPFKKMWSHVYVG